MAVIRLFLLVAVLFGLTLLLVQNLSPVISLTFLGVKTQALPLASWILFSTGAGAITSLLITSLFNLSNYFTRQTQKTPRKSPATYTSANSSRREEPRKEPPPPNASLADDDWDQDSSKDDWDFDSADAAPKTEASSSTQQRQQEPKSGSKSGSVYSYSYQEPKNSGVGKTESVYDVDYRVIVPPHQSSTTNKADDDDWGFLDEDDEDKDQRDRST